MAEFQEVMRQFDRMCKARPGCDNCPLSGHCSIGEFINDSERIEREILSWAAEHPKPVYPTWGEYLHALHNEPSSRELSKPIPADIAQKLGIEPKEDA